MGARAAAAPGSGERLRRRLAAVGVLSLVVIVGVWVFPPAGPRRFREPLPFEPGLAVIVNGQQAPR